jgi:hypothetical protein
VDVVQSVATLGTIAVGLAALGLSAYTSKVSLHHQSAEAQRARLWEKRSDVYVEVLNTLQSVDIQEWAAPGSTSWENLLSSDAHGRIMAFGSADMRSAWMKFIFATTKEDRQSAMGAIETAVARDLQGHDRERRTWLAMRRKPRENGQERSISA